jgi:hypothetical protein
LPTSLAPVSFGVQAWLVLTTDSSGSGAIGAAGLADFVIVFERRLVWGPPLSQAQLDAYFTARTTQEQGLHWQYHTPAWRLERSGGKGLGLIEFCARYDTVELWIDPDPNAQLNQIWLLDFLRGHEQLALKMGLVHADVSIGGLGPKKLKRRRWPRVQIGKDHLEAAGLAWRAWRSPTPQAWFDLLERDLTVLPRFRSSIVQLLEELPDRVTGLGATELRMLELLSERKASPFGLFPGYKLRNKRRVFGYWEVGELLDGLAHCPAPVVVGLNEGPFTMDLHDDRQRLRRYKQSKLSLTALGKAIAAQTEDFGRHNPIQRWWGGTELTNDRLWRWDAASRALVTP